jgi:hypothetical protein
MGRPANRSKIVETLEASEHARERLRAILQSMEGRPIAELCEQLGMERAYFDRMRKDTLQAAARSLEPKTTGPKPKVVDPRDERIATLEADVTRLRLELEATRLRAQLAIALPSVVKKTKH